MDPPVELITLLRTDSDTELRTCALATAADARKRQEISSSACFQLLTMCLTLRMSDVFFVFAPSFCWTMFTFRQQVHSDTQSESRRVRSRLSAIFLLWAPVEIFPFGRHPQLHRSH